MKKKPVSKRDKTLNMIKYTDMKIIKEDFKKSKSSYSETEKSSWQSDKKTTKEESPKKTMKKGQMEEIRGITMNLKETLKRKWASKTWEDKETEMKQTLKTKDIRNNLDQVIMKGIKEGLKKDLDSKEKEIKMAWEKIKIKMIKD